MHKTDKEEGIQRFLGMPMRWQWNNVLKSVWNKEDDRIFPPKYFGIGWGLNFHALLKRLGIVKI